MPPARARSAAAAPAVELEKPFDIHAWLTGSDPDSPTPEPVTTSVTVYLMPHLAAKLNALADEIEAAEGRERTMADQTPAKLAREWEALKQKFDAATLTLKLRQRVPGDYEMVRQRMNEDGVPATKERSNFYLVSQFLVDPALTADEVRKLGERIGAPQFEQIVQAMDAMVGALPEVTVPKSLRP
jgi:hypothetical protein